MLSIYIGRTTFFTRVFAKISLLFYTFVQKEEIKEKDEHTRRRKQMKYNFVDVPSVI